jgi:hypothetical protein
MGKLYSTGLLLGIVEKQKNHLKKLSFMNRFSEMNVVK